MPADSAVKVRSILAPHRERSVRRIRGQRTVLAIQDGTDLNFATRPGCEGLEAVGTNQTGAKSLGLASARDAGGDGVGPAARRPAAGLRFDEGPPAGGHGEEEDQAVAGRLRRHRQGGPRGEPRNPRGRGVRPGRRTASRCSTRSGAIREVELLVRARHDRSLGPRRPEAVRPDGRRRAGRLDRRRDRRLGGEAQVERTQGPAPARRKRLACCELRVRRAVLPTTGAVPDAEPAPVSAVHVVETAPPDGEAPVEWRLLTTLDVRTAKAAAEIVGYYLQRWRIEDFFRVLKSGWPDRVPAVPHRRPAAEGRSPSTPSSPGASWR